MKNQLITSADILGRALRAVRKRKKMTQSDLAGLIGVKQATISNAENATPGMRMETLFRILSGLDLSIVLADRKVLLQDDDEW